MSTQNIESADQGKAEALSSAALARRRILLKGVSKGTAVLAATIPIQTLAGQSVLTPGGLHQCTISGTQSGVHSATTSTAVCGGYSISHWGAVNVNGNANGNGNGNANHAFFVQATVQVGAANGNGNGGQPANTWPTLPSSWDYKTGINSVLSPNNLMNAPTLFDVMNVYASTPEAHWICAWLNALWNAQHSGILNFPYDESQVLGFYNQGAASLAYIDALEFFTTYMEGIS